MLKKILIGLVVLIIGVLVYGATLPDDFRVARSTTINAPAQKIFPYLVNVKTMDTWNPWMKLDPNLKVSYSGPAEGVGATSHWDGNKDIGTGSATVIDVQNYSLVRVRLDYEKPFKSTSTVEYNLKSENGKTVLEWSNQGKSPFIGKIICALFMNMDKMVGGMFEKGLAELKTRVEASN